MKTLEFHSEIGSDGKLRVEVPVNLPPGPVEGVVVVQPVNPVQGPPYDLLENAFAGRLSAAIDIDAALDEMNKEWKDTLEPPA